MFQATRRRLALWYAIVTAILLVLFAASVYLYVRITLVDRVDDTLKHVIEVVERSLVLEPAPQDATHHGVTIDIAASFRWSETTRNFNEDRIDLEWFSPTGDLLWTTWDRILDIPLDFSPSGRTVSLNASAIAPDPTPQIPTASDLGASRDLAANLPHTPQPLRQITKLIKYDHQPLGYLRVSHPWFEVTQPSQDLMIDLGFGILCVVVTISAIGWWLSGIAMRPVLDSYERLRQFTADASHELRSPISSIQTNIQVALREPDLSRIPDRLKVVERTTRRLSQLVDDLLFLARQDSPLGEAEFELIPLDALILETVEEQQAIAAEKHLTLSLEIHDSLILPAAATQTFETFEPFETCDTAELVTEVEPYSIQGNWNQITRLLTNLLSNAIRYTPDYGEIHVILRDRQDGNEHHTIVEIRDTGIGIAPEDLTRIFERFYRVDTSRHRQLGSDHGSGLGLSIVKAIADQHDAQIMIDSQCDRGTTVTLTFVAASFEPHRKFTTTHNVQSV
ncbi:MAG: sensor histidine kinase [Oscillatoriales cyanobacterium]|nr:MAG: sensor histidine kinase [Oscillatoriales cyanobacterium]